MRRFTLGAAIWLLAFSQAYSQGCTNDTQCKGDRVCTDGKCVSPGPGDNPALGSPGQASLPTFCCTPAGKLGPFKNPGPNGVTVQNGAQCYWQTPSGPAVGTACY